MVSENLRHYFLVYLELIIYFLMHMYIFRPELTIENRGKKYLAGARISYPFIKSIVIMSSHGSYSTVWFPVRAQYNLGHWYIRNNSGTNGQSWTEGCTTLCVQVVYLNIQSTRKRVKLITSCKITFL